MILSVEAISPLNLLGPVDKERLAELKDMLPGQNFRRVPRLARLALRAAALEAAPRKSEGQGCALVLSTAYGSVDNTFEFMNSILDGGPSLASPTAFSHSVTNMSAALMSQQLGLTGPSLTITQDAFGPALLAAATLLAASLAETVVLGAVGEHNDLMSQMENLARPGGATGPDEGAIFFRLKNSAKQDLKTGTSFDFRRQGQQGPLFQAGNLAREFLRGPGSLKVIIDDQNEIILCHPGVAA